MIAQLSQLVELTANVARKDYPWFGLNLGSSDVCFGFLKNIKMQYYFLCMAASEVYKTKQANVTLVSAHTLYCIFGLF